LVYEYLLEQFDARYFDLSIEYAVNDSPGLRTLWSSERREFSSVIKNADNTYASQSALCYNQKKPLWVVDADKKPLQAGENCRDMWSKLAELPPYRAPVDHTPLFTSVLIPICRPNNRILGVMNVDSSKYYEITDFDSDELTILADALGVLYDLHEIHKMQTQGTSDALDHLGKIKESAGPPRHITPQVFVSFSDRADNEVVGILLDVLQNLESQPRVVTWRDIDASGQISKQIDEAINDSQVGVCFLSEPNDQDGYQDNDNVLIEVGMFRERDVTQEQETCLLIREKNSPRCPFNIAGDRIVYVPRTSNGVNDPMFRSDLKSKLNWIIARTI